jgi:hypothetical protein
MEWLLLVAFSIFGIFSGLFEAIINVIPRINLF